MNLEIQPERTHNFAAYQKELFKLSQSGSHPDFDTHPDELEKKAKETLSKGGWLYASCNAGVSWTHDANREGERELSKAHSLYQRSIDIVSSRACCATPLLETRRPSCSDTRSPRRSALLPLGSTR